VTQRWQYVRYPWGEEELYDSDDDPHQLRNLLAQPETKLTTEQSSALADLRSALRRLSTCAGPVECSLR
jgi:hypothetical protein